MVKCERQGHPRMKNLSLSGRVVSVEACRDVNKNSVEYNYMTACTPAGYLGGQEEIKSHCELCKF